MDEDQNFLPFPFSSVFLFMPNFWTCSSICFFLSSALYEGFDFKNGFYIPTSLIFPFSCGTDWISSISISLLWDYITKFVQID